MALSSETVLHTPELTHWQTADGVHLALDAEGPSWLATDDRGARILGLCDGHRPLAAVAVEARLYADPITSLQHVISFAEAAVRAGIASEAPFHRAPYAGRAERLTGWALRELWLHTNNSCNLRCEHCLVSSGPDGDKGLPTEVLLSVVDQARDLGAERVFFTGGEPFLRRDLSALIDRVTAHHGLDLVILTNATLFEPSNRSIGARCVSRSPSTAPPPRTTTPSAVKAPLPAPLGASPGSRRWASRPRSPSFRTGVTSLISPACPPSPGPSAPARFTSCGGIAAAAGSA